MLRTLGITSLIKWFVLISIGLAVWRSFAGDPVAIGHAAWGAVQQGADAATNIWTMANTH